MLLNILLSSIPSLIACVLCSPAVVSPGRSPSRAESCRVVPGGHLRARLLPQFFRQFGSCWGGAFRIRLLIASLQGLLLTACYTLLLYCRRQSGICVPIACCKMHEILLILLGNENRKMRASSSRSY